MKGCSLSSKASAMEDEEEEEEDEDGVADCCLDATRLRLYC